MKKKCLAILMIFALLVLTVGCSSSNPGDVADNQNTETGNGAASEGEATYPDQAITLIIPVAAGAGADLHGRKLASIAEKYLGQPIIVENIAGGNQALGTVGMLNRAPDGYTICQTSPSLCTTFLDPNAPFTREDFQPLLAFNGEPNGFTVRSDSGFETMEDVIEYAKANPGELKISSSGSGSNSHLTLELLAKAAGFTYTYIPYDGGKDAVLALMGKNVDAIGTTPANSEAQYETGEFKLLAVSGSERMEKYPDAPSYEELGYDVPVINWRGILVDKDVPADIVAILEDAFMKAAQDPEFIKFNEENGQLAGYLKNAEEFGQLIDETTESFREVSQG